LATDLLQDAVVGRKLGASLVLALSLLGVVAGVFGLAYADLRSEEGRALDDFIGDQAALARSAAALVRSRIERVGRDLRATDDEIASGRGGALSRLLAEDPAYQLAQRFDADEVETQMARGEALPSRDVLVPDLAEVLAQALPLTSVPLAVGHLRLFAFRGARQTLALVVDLDRLLVDLLATSAAAGAPLRFVVLDEARRSIQLGDALPQAAPGPPPSELESLRAEMGAGRAGTAVLSRPAAAALGLGARLAVAGYAPVELHDGRWSVAVVASARRVRDRARLAVWRLAAATGLAGLLVALFGVLISRQQRRAQELANALALAEAGRNLARAEKLATIGTLAAGVAHEIGTPLGIISGRAEQLLADAPTGEAGQGTRKILNSILGQVDKVSTTIRQLLDFARARPSDTARVAPAHALQEAAALLDHRFRQARVALQIDAAPTVPSIVADAGQLEQVLVNLMINACDACAAGGHVGVRAAEQDGQVLFEVCDDGTGIAPENLARVLDPFFTTKKRGQGTGLGLTIAADIVKNHGGSLELQSAVGQGTTIRVLLPRAVEAGP
jgi:signal transduction histidine kinase